MEKEKIKTKDRLLQEAYKLFASKPYDQVTFTDLEKATKLSRGAILYHIQNKENLFRQVLDKYLINRHTKYFILKYNPTISLKCFIEALIAVYAKEVEIEKSIGIANINLALLNILSSAFSIFPEMRPQMDVWCNSEVNLWKQVLENALQQNEIKPDTDIERTAEMFYTVYLGLAYRGITKPHGFEVEKAEKEFFMLYGAIKKPAF